MKALILIENEYLEYKDVPFPKKLTDDSYLIKIVSSGICGSDIHRAFGGGAYNYPLIMGHEFAGIIVETFTGSRYREGERVTIFPLLPCHRCKPCKTGDYAQCINYNYFGSRCDGGFAEYVFVPEENLFPIPEHVDIIHAAMTEPCAVALHGISKLHLKAGETALVYGGGPIGNISAQWLRIFGCDPVYIVEVEEKKIEIAKNMKFKIIDARDSDPVAAIYSITGNEGADKVVEACGLPLTYLQAIKSTGRFGEVLLLGNLSGELKINQKDFSDILRKELTLYGTWNSKIVPSGKDDWSTVLKYMDRELIVAPLISHTPELQDGADIFNTIWKKKGYFNKVIFKIK